MLLLIQQELINLLRRNVATRREQTVNELSTISINVPTATFEKACEEDNLTPQSPILHDLFDERRISIGSSSEEEDNSDSGTSSHMSDNEDTATF